MPNISDKQQSVLEFLKEPTEGFIIPEYQRPYTWPRENCVALWEDITNYVEGIKNEPGNPVSYFFGTLVMLEEKRGVYTVIDGQQRIITFMLLLRAFYEYCKSIADYDDYFSDNQIRDAKIEIMQSIKSCLWNGNQYNWMLQSENSKVVPRVKSYVISSESEQDLLDILDFDTSSKRKKGNSLYIKNYNYFLAQIKEEFEGKDREVLSFIYTILHKCAFIPLITTTQESALTIFETTNQRGTPLTYADIFKAKIYKTCADTLSKREFINQWGALDKLCAEAFKFEKGRSNIEILFRYYLTYINWTNHIYAKPIYNTMSLYAENSYAALRDTKILDNLMVLADFLKKINNFNPCFSERVLRLVAILKYGHCTYWLNIMSAFYLANKETDNTLNEEKLFNFLNWFVSFVLACSLTYGSKGIDIRTHLYDAMRYLDSPELFKVGIDQFSTTDILHYIGTENYKCTKPLVCLITAWWIFRQPEQPVPTTNIELVLKALNPSKDLPAPYNKVMHGNSILLQSNKDTKTKDMDNLGERILKYDGFVIDEFEKMGEYSVFTVSAIAARQTEITETLISHLREKNMLK